MTSKQLKRAMECLRHAMDHCQNQGDREAERFLYPYWMALVNADWTMYCELRRPAGKAA